MIAPNPAVDLLTISTVEGVTEGITSVDVFSINGDLMFSDTPDRLAKSGLQRVSLDVAELKPGVYYARIMDDSGATHTKKFIKI